MHGIPPLTIPGKIEEIIFEASLIRKDGVGEFVKDDEFINGLQSHEVLLQEHVTLDKAKVQQVCDETSNTKPPLTS